MHGSLFNMIYTCKKLSQHITYRSTPIYLKIHIFPEIHQTIDLFLCQNIYPNIRRGLDPCQPRIFSKSEDRFHGFLHLEGLRALDGRRPWRWKSPWAFDEKLAMWKMMCITEMICFLKIAADFLVEIWRVWHLPWMKTLEHSTCEQWPSTIQGYFGMVDWWWP